MRIVKDLFGREWRFDVHILGWCDSTLETAFRTNNAAFCRSLANHTEALTMLAHTMTRGQYSDINLDGFRAGWHPEMRRAFLGELATKWEVFQPILLTGICDVHT